MKNIIVASLFTLAFISSCTNEMVTGPNGENYQIVHAIRFDGLDAAQGEFPRISFTLTNTTENTLCFSKYSPSRYYGQIDYFLQDGTSFQNTVSFSHWAPILNWPSDENYLRPNAEHAIAPGEKFEIVRVLTPAIYKSEANVDMAANSPFNGAFEGQIDLFAEIEVLLYSCDISNPTDRSGADLFLFRSRRAGPFRVNTQASSS